MEASLWPLVAIVFIACAYKLIDKHLKTQTISADLVKQMKDLESKINEVSLRTFGRK